MCDNNNPVSKKRYKEEDEHREISKSDNENGKTQTSRAPPMYNISRAVSSITTRPPQAAFPLRHLMMVSIRFEGQQTHVANRVADPKTGEDDLARAGQAEHEIFNKT